ncbi:hypothetical protein [Agilicoccus flavus]|uniref:hypothetical protein n=1 Tax=Agilicoccus flavus TaxID=2775968 RepID=UPI001CF6CDDF|nr:hypothetical protein [Agilicoccus flavus]
MRWWGPDRLLVPEARENGDANPLWVGERVMVPPGSAELVVGGQLLAALGLLFLVFLPWRGRSRWAAAPGLLLGAAGVGGPALQWLAARVDGVPSPSGRSSAVEYVIGAGQLGLGAGLLLLALALLAGSREAAPRRTRVLPAVVACLAASTLLVEFLTLSAVSESHDDPVGTHVFSGLALAGAGAVLLWSVARDRRALPGRAARGPGSAGPVVPDTDTGRSRTTRRAAAVCLLGSALAAAAAAATAALTGVGADPMAEPVAALPVLAVVEHVGIAGACVLLAAEPRRGWALLAALTAGGIGAVGAGAGAVLNLIPLIGAEITGPLMWDRWGLGLVPLALVSFSLLLVAGRLGRPQQRSRAVVAVVAASLVFAASRPFVVQNLMRYEGDQWVAALVGALGVLVLAAAWWAAGRTRPAPR